MKIGLLLFLASIVIALVFTYFSYSVAKERWVSTDFDTTVRLQDHISRKFDRYFSLLSLLGSVEVTCLLAIFFSILSLLHKNWLAVIGWLLIFPASLGEVFGKLVLYHPAPPVFLHRTALPTGLPSFYVHTDFSYPSGHMTRTIFLITVLVLIIIYSRKNVVSKYFLLTLLLGLALLMGLTRVYLGEHWLSDVLGGMLLGMTSGLFAAILILPKKPTIA